MSWKPQQSALKLWSMGFLTDAELGEVQGLEGTDYDSPAATMLREILESKGYDGVVYPNGIEGTGDSFIAFRNDQIVQTDILSAPTPNGADSHTRSAQNNELPDGTVRLPTWEDIERRKKYSISESYRSEIKDWDERGRPNGETFILGMTGDVLQGLGAIENDIYMLSDKMNAILSKHSEMTLEELKRIPEILDDPVLVLKSKGSGKNRSNTRLVVFGSLKAHNGLPVLSILDLRPFEGKLLIDDMQKVNSAYTKTGNAANFIMNSDVLYADKNRTNQLFRSIGLTIASRPLLRHGSLGSITYEGGNVKLDGVPMKNILMPQSSYGADSHTRSAQDDEIPDGTVRLPTLDDIERRKKYSVSEKERPAESGADSAVYLNDAEFAESLMEEREWLLSLEKNAPALREEAQENGAQTQEDIEELLRQYDEAIEEVSAYLRPQTIPADNVTLRVESQKQSLKESISDAWSFFRRKFEDSGEAVQRVGNATNDKYLYAFFNAARASLNAANNFISGAASDVMGRSTGKSLNDIFSPIRKKGEEYYRKFQLYLFHRHNVDRMSIQNDDALLFAQAAFAEFRNENPELSVYADFQLEKMAYNPDSEFHLLAKEYIALRDDLRRAENTRNKPVFGFDITAEMSSSLAEELLAENPDFEAEAEEVYAYIDNLMRYRVDSGLITEDEYQKLKERYPHYVPTFRTTAADKTDTRKIAFSSKKGEVQIGRTVGRATGGKEKLVPLHKALAEQTLSVVREGSKNRFGMRLLDTNAHKVNGASAHVRSVEEYHGEVTPESLDDIENEDFQRKNVFIIREGGKRYALELSPALFEAVQALSPDAPERNVLMRVMRIQNELFKKLVTSYNPAFLVRNFLRDPQDALLFSKDASAFIKQYPQAIAEIASNGRYWQQYKALGGLYSNSFDYETGEMKQGKGPISRGVDKVTGRIEFLNMAVEQAPRLAEFMATVKKVEDAGGEVTMEVLMEAMHNAAEVTTNFGRSGTWGKWLNSYLVPFFNPGVQGASKMIRTVTETKGLKGWTRLAAKAALFGLAPVLLNRLLYGDDDEWDKLKDRDKDIYYLFKIGDGMWLKLPKGRALSLIGMSSDRVIKMAEGDDADWGGFLNTAANQVAPASPFENNIFAAWFDTKLFDADNPGETWYGSDIESQRLRNYAPGERYDAKTDFISKWIGKTFNLSPKKINYLLDQYTGVIGDVALPYMTQSADGNLLSPFTAAFTLNSTYSNRLSGDFYETLDRLTYKKNGVDATGADVVVFRWWNKQAQAVAEANTAIRETEADGKLSDSEKKELNEVNYAIRNGIEDAALQKLDTYSKAAEKYYRQSKLTDEDDRIDEAYRNANREVFGAEYALKTYNDRVYEKAKALYEKKGVSYDQYFDTYFSIREAEEEKGDDLSKAEEYLTIAQMPYGEEVKSDLLSNVMSEKAFEKLTSVMETGITAYQYCKFLYDVNWIEADRDEDGKAISGSKRKKVSDVIFKMDLTDEQKDALYLSQGYAQSGLDDTPWRDPFYR